MVQEMRDWKKPRNSKGCAHIPLASTPVGRLEHMARACVPVGKDIAQLCPGRARGAGLAEGGDGHQGAGQKVLGESRACWANQLRGEAWVCTEGSWATRTVSELSFWSLWVGWVGRLPASREGDESWQGFGPALADSCCQH